MTKIGTDTAALQAAIIPALGVVPPSKSASHSSSRRAPPRSAASDDATESTQASTRIGALSAVRPVPDCGGDDSSYRGLCDFVRLDRGQSEAGEIIVRKPEEQLVGVQVSDDEGRSSPADAQGLDAF